MLCAAIAYVEDQNEPSRPYLLELPDEPEQFVNRLHVEHIATFGEILGAGDDEDGQWAQRGVSNKIEVANSYWGDIQTDDCDGSHLIVTVPEEFKQMVKTLLNEE